MVNKDEALKLYNEGETLQFIGDKFNVSRQRIWQVLKPFNKDITYQHRDYTMRVTKNPRPEEIFIANKLKKLGLNVEFQSYNNYFDLLVNNKKVEIKYRTIPVKKNDTTNLYYEFIYNVSKDIIDFYIFIVGKLPNSDFYIIPSNKTKKHFVVPVSPRYKTKKNRFYKNNWASLI